MLGTRYLGRGRVGLVANKTVVLDTEAGTEGGFFCSPNSSVRLGSGADVGDSKGTVIS